MAKRKAEVVVEDRTAVAEVGEPNPIPPAESGPPAMLAQVLETVMLHPDEIVVDEELNSRDSTGPVDDLVASLVQGQTTPIKVRRMDGLYHLVEGYRRHKAARLIDEESLAGPEGFRLRAEVVECTDAQAFVSNVIENNLRKDLGTVEKARAMDRLVNEFGMTQANVARQMGVNRSVVNKHLKILEAPRAVLRMLGQGKTTLEAVLDVLGEPEECREEGFASLVEAAAGEGKATKAGARKKARDKAEEAGGQTGFTGSARSKSLTMKEIKVFWVGLRDEELPEGANTAPQVLADWVIRHYEGRHGDRAMRSRLAGLTLGE